jgi:hypothetical protein
MGELPVRAKMLKTEVVRSICVKTLSRVCLEVGCTNVPHLTASGNGIKKLIIEMA